MNENNWLAKWSRAKLKTMLVEQYEAFWKRDLGVERQQLNEILKLGSSPHAVVISGLRRVGKSTLLAQLAHRLGGDAFYYVNFEDERFISFQAEDANLLFQLLVEVFGERKIFILDEVQNVAGWERFVRRFMDMDYKFYLTGSNASLLSRELGSRLTGRYLPVELLPFSFDEFLFFGDHEQMHPGPHTTIDHAILQRKLNDYLSLGGLPESLKYPELPLHQTLYDDVLFRDIAARYHINEIGALRELAFYLISNPATLVSFNKLKERLKLGSVNTVKNYIDYLEMSWLIFVINVYDFSVKRQQIAPKKNYVIDTGLAKSVGFAFSIDSGRLLENLIYLALRRKTNDIYYYLTPEGYEVDFYLPKTHQLIQVAQNIDQTDTFEREVRALYQAMNILNIQESLLLTMEAHDIIHEGDKVIKIAPIAVWLLEN